MATVATQTFSTTAGLVATYSSASGGGDKFTPNSKTVVHVKNANGSSVTPTFATPAVDHDSGLAIADLAVAVANGAERFYGPFPEAIFRGTASLCDITWSASSGVTFAVLSLP